MAEVKPLNSAACELCRAVGRDTAVEWQGSLDEQAIRDMCEHLRDTHVPPLPIQLNVRDGAMTFTIGDD